ncbi:hypothetical protein BGZ90_006542, partial [Linnemannia elongata]
MSWPRGNFARRGKLFIPRYSPDGPRRFDFKNATHRDQSVNGGSDSEPDESSCDEVYDSDKENEDLAVSQPNREFEHSE